MCPNQQERWRHWIEHPQHPSHGFVHSRNKWNVQRHCPHAAGVLQHREETPLVISSVLTLKQARYVDQGGGKRKGAFAIYLEPWHADITEFLDLRKNHGKEELRARDLFYSLWIPDLFMKRVESNGQWSLFCPNEAPGLSDCWGKEFEALYEKYEAEVGKIRRASEADLSLGQGKEDNQGSTAVVFHS